MEERKGESNKIQAKYIYGALFGAGIGAVLGLMAYTNNWLG
ncbi:hypothetical protein SFC65_19625 [Priestia filamentosa]